MAPQQPDETDSRIRESFGLEPEAVQRIVAGAQTAGAEQPRRAWPIRAVLATVGVLALAAAIAWWPASRPPATSGATEVASITGSLTDGVLVVTWPDGSASILGPDRGAERPPDGFGIVLVEGADK